MMIKVKQTRPSWCFLQDIRGVGFPVASQLPKKHFIVVINHGVLLYHDHHDDEIVDDDHDFHGDDGREYEYGSPISIRDPSHDEGCGMARQRNAWTQKKTIWVFLDWTAWSLEKVQQWPAKLLDHFARITPVARPGRKQRPKLTWIGCHTNSYSLILHFLLQRYLLLFYFALFVTTLFVESCKYQNFMQTFLFPFSPSRSSRRSRRSRRRRRRKAT